MDSFYCSGSSNPLSYVTLEICSSLIMSRDYVLLLCASFGSVVLCDRHCHWGKIGRCGRSVGMFSTNVENEEKEDQKRVHEVEVHKELVHRAEVCIGVLLACIVALTGMIVSCHYYVKKHCHSDTDTDTERDTNDVDGEIRSDYNLETECDSAAPVPTVVISNSKGDREMPLSCNNLRYPESIITS